MNLEPLDVPALLHQYGLRPSKKLGQNFLQDEQALRKIAEIADIQEQDPRSPIFKGKRPYWKSAPAWAD